MNVLTYKGMAGSKTIPLLDGLQEISTAQRDEFRQNGHLIVRGLLSAAEVGIYRQLVVDVVRQRSKEPDCSCQIAWLAK